VLAALATCAGQAATVYKWTDSDGVVHYSDQAVPGAEKITTAGGLSSGKASAARAPGNFGAINLAPPRKDGVQGLGYTQASITSPTADQTFFGDETVGVQLLLEPTLKLGHTISWRLNGREVEIGPTETQFSLPHLDRGTYALAAVIMDPQSGESQSTASVSFFVRQPTALSPTLRPTPH
jgi:Domain of unknown function (DUF4124)